MEKNTLFMERVDLSYPVFLEQVVYVEYGGFVDTDGGDAHVGGVIEVYLGDALSQEVA